MRSLKEQLLRLWRFATIEQLQRALRDFKDRYNREWLIERHGWISPNDQYQKLIEADLAA